jgi:uncharacterized protein YukE
MGKLKLARILLRALTSQLRTRITSVDEIGQSIINELLPKTDSWQDASADTFRQEVRTDLLNAFRDLASRMLTFPTNLDRAADTIEAADQKSANQVQNLSRQFSNIYK